MSAMLCDGGDHGDTARAPPAISAPSRSRYFVFCSSFATVAVNASLTLFPMSAMSYDAGDLGDFLLTLKRFPADTHFT
jgi:hypothetical protein